MPFIYDLIVLVSPWRDFIWIITPVGNQHVTSKSGEVFRGQYKREAAWEGDFRAVVKLMWFDIVTEAKWHILLPALVNNDQ